MTEQVKASKITNPERLKRVFTKMCSAGMHALLRTNEDANLGIRAVFHLIDESNGQNVLYLNGISEKGRRKLESSKIVRVEVLGMPTRVMFDAAIVRHYGEGIGIAVPDSIVSVERRQNTRYQTLPRQMAYLVLSSWQAEDEDWAAPPVIPIAESMASWLPLADISMGGMCVLTHFPAALTAAAPTTIDENARLIFPMIGPVPVKVQIRWQKRTIDRKIVGDREHSQRQFRFGIEFVDPDENVKLKVRQFMRQLSMADAI